jgi:Raf kinase inhibitor-like YbhB/YbcL family protein
MLKALTGWALAASLGSTAAWAFELTSPDIAPGAKISEEYVYNGFGCTGKNVSPTLKWSGAPGGTKSFALMLYDPDAPTGSGFWHWVMFDIPANVTELPQGAGDLKSGKPPAGAIQSLNDFGVPGYGGPCPPQGDPQHHYHFMLFAVNADKLGPDANATGAFVGFNLHFHTLAKTEFVAVYSH